MTDPGVRFWSKVSRGAPDECWPWMGKRTRGGYGIFTIGYLTKTASSYSLSLLLGRPLDAGMRALHHCDNPPCVNPAHLFEGTQQENIADARAKGRLATGPRHGMRLHPERRSRGADHYSQLHPERLKRGEDRATKLTEALVAEIRSRLAQGATQVSLAPAFGVSESMIWKIAHGKVWAPVHVSVGP